LWPEEVHRREREKERYCERASIALIKIITRIEESRLSLIEKNLLSIYLRREEKKISNRITEETNSMIRLNRLSKMIDSLKRDLHVYINIHPLEKNYSL